MDTIVFFSRCCKTDYEQLSIIRSALLKTRLIMGFILLPFCFFSFPQGIFAEKIPHEVGGFVLGSDVTDYPSIEYSNFLKEVVVYDWNGFDKGIISYGICKYPGKIVKIKLKYADSSKKYFKILLKKFKKKLGKPNEWKGDSFGILHIWKWKFIDEQKRKVHLILQYNHKNPNENIGNMVKLYYPDRIAEEQKCFTKQCSNGNKPKPVVTKDNWDYLIPK